MDEQRERVEFMTTENLKIPKFYQKENLFPSQIGTKLVIKKLDF